LGLLLFLLVGLLIYENRVPPTSAANKINNIFHFIARGTIPSG
jgi:hypothetical protein